MSSQPFQRDSYRKRNGFRGARKPGRDGLGRGGGQWQRSAEANAAHHAEEARKRADREARLRPSLVESAAATDAWAAIFAVLAGALQPSTVNLWLRPLTCLGEAEDALILAAPDRIRTWVERRYGHLIGDEIRKHTDYRGAYFLRAEDETEEDRPL